jgi:glycogen operon protein
MLLAGDELGRTQRGNNNAYCQDNEVSWVDWEAAGKHEGLLEFTRGLIALRRDHAVFRRRRFFSGELGGQRDISWLTPAGTEMTQADWQASYARSLAVLLNGEAITEPGPRGETITDRSFLLLFNAHYEPVTFTLPPAAEGWEVMFDTSESRPSAAAVLASASSREVAGHAVVVLKAAAA